MVSQSQIYCIDTSSLIDLWQRHPPDLFPGPWERLSELAQAGRLVAPREVRRELEVGDDELTRWAARQPRLFHDPTEPELEAVKEILAQFDNFVDPDKEIPEADPFVVAFALVHNRSQASSLFPHRCVVVTEENRRRDATRRPRIPDVCGHYDINCMKLFGLMRAEGWSFR